MEGLEDRSVVPGIRNRGITKGQQEEFGGNIVVLYLN